MICFKRAQGRGSNKLATIASTLGNFLARNSWIVGSETSVARIESTVVALAKLCRKAGLNPLDKTPCYEVSTNDMWLKYKSGRFYNKVFRQIYKVRHRFFNPSDADSAAEPE